MKKLLILAVAFTLSLGAFAQDTTHKKMDKHMDHKMGMKKDCVMMEDGKMMVMKEGKVVETGAAAEIFKSPKTAYTRALFAAAFNLEASPEAVVAQ